jgi:DNA-nicking Smr family endonuclease
MAKQRQEASKEDETLILLRIKTFRPIRNATAINAATQRKNSFKVSNHFTTE